MIKRRAFTLVETLLASVLTAIVVGALISLYTLVATRTVRAYSESLAIWQSSKVADTISAYVSNAVEVAVVNVNGVSCLKCTMPDLGKYPNGSGRFDLYEPNAVIGLSAEQFNPGSRVWFYLGDASGNPSAIGTHVHKAVRSDEANPGPGDLDTAWEQYPGSTGRRWTLVSSATFLYNATYRYVTFSVSANTMSFGERQAVGTTATANRYDITITRRVLARNFRG